MTIRECMEKWDQLTAIKLWDDKMNGGTVDEIKFNQHTKYYFKCDKGIHSSNLYSTTGIYREPNHPFKCRYCNSFGQKIIDKFGKEFLDKIWSDKNDKSPFEYSYNSYYKAWFNCPNGIHEPYERRVDTTFIQNCRCAECSNMEHPNQKQNLIGQKFGRLTPVKRLPFNKKAGGTYYLCDCDCGTKNVKVQTSVLTSGKQVSCGCWRTEKVTGENNVNWKDGILSEARLARNTRRYTRWRNAVYQRDNYTCQCCGVRGGRLNAHHIKSFANFPDLRYEVSNGITLCESCHSWEYKGSLHNIYGSKDVTPEQLFFYIKQRKEHIA